MPLFLGNLMFFFAYSGYLFQLTDNYHSAIENRELPDFVFYSCTDINEVNISWIIRNQYHLTSFSSTGWIAINCQLNGNNKSFVLIFADESSFLELNGILLNTTSCVISLIDEEISIGEQVNISINMGLKKLVTSFTVVGNETAEQYFYSSFINILSNFAITESNAIIVGRSVYYHWLSELGIDSSNVGARYLIYGIFSDEFLLNITPLEAKRYVSTAEERIRALFSIDTQDPYFYEFSILAQTLSISTLISKTISNTQEMLFQLFIIIVPSFLVYYLLISYAIVFYFQKNRQRFALFEEKGLSSYKLLFMIIMLSIISILLAISISSIFSILYLLIAGKQGVIGFTSILLFYFAMNLIFGSIQMNVIISEWLKNHKKADAKLDGRHKIRKIILNVILQSLFVFVLYLGFNLFVSSSFISFNIAFQSTKPILNYVPGIIFALEFLFLNNELLKYGLLGILKLLYRFASLGAITVQFIQQIFVKVSRFLHLIFLFYLIAFSFAIFIDTDEHFRQQNYYFNLPDKLAITYSFKHEKTFTEEIAPIVNETITVYVYLAYFYTAVNAVPKVLVFGILPDNISSFFADEQLLHYYKGELKAEELSKVLIKDKNSVSVSKALNALMPYTYQSDKVKINLLSPDQTMYATTFLSFVSSIDYMPLFAYYSHYYSTPIHANRDYYVVINNAAVENLIDTTPPIRIIKIIDVNSDLREDIISKTRTYNSKNGPVFEIVDTKNASILNQDFFNPSVALNTFKTLFILVDVITLFLILLFFNEIFFSSYPLIFLFASRGAKLNTLFSRLFFSLVLILLFYIVVVLSLAFAIFEIISILYIRSKNYIPVHAIINSLSLLTVAFLLVPPIIIAGIIIAYKYFRTAKLGLNEIIQRDDFRWG
ncbi:MAG: hypothetical protein ACTSYD_06775 [Candidatus Heimdallarchaeaceae archaeon]